MEKKVILYVHCPSNFKPHDIIKYSLHFDGLSSQWYTLKSLFLEKVHSTTLRSFQTRSTFHKRVVDGTPSRRHTGIRCTTSKPVIVWWTDTLSPVSSTSTSTWQRRSSPHRRQHYRTAVRSRKDPSIQRSTCLYTVPRRHRRRESCHCTTDEPLTPRRPVWDVGSLPYRHGRPTYLCEILP